MPDIAGWITVVAYGIVVVVALLRQWFGWGRSWRLYSRPGTLIASIDAQHASDERPRYVVYCPEHSYSIPDGLRTPVPPDKCCGHIFQIVVPAATGIWRWSYIFANGNNSLGRWRWRYECARNALTRRFQEPDIGGCPECVPVKAHDPKLDRTLGTTRYV